MAKDTEATKALIEFSLVVQRHYEELAKGQRFITRAESDVFMREAKLRAIRELEAA
jgi:hypothetical protein